MVGGGAVAKLTKALSRRSRKYTNFSANENNNILN